MRQAWEYKVVADAGEKTLNKLGEEGWELIMMNEGYAYLKRPKS